MRKTAYQRIRYPWTADVVNPVDVDTMASDIDQSLVQTANLSAIFSKMASAVILRTAAQSITKGTLTAISFNATPGLDNGSDSPLANGAWFNPSNPTRLTAPVPCIVLAHGFAGINFTTALGTAGCLQVTITINGGTAAPNVQGSKYSPFSTIVGQQWTSAMSMWKLNAGDFLELKVFWTGTPAGPFSTDTAQSPTLSVMMLGLPTVA